MSSKMSGSDSTSTDSTDSVPVIIAGSRDFGDGVSEQRAAKYVEQHLEELGFTPENISTVVSGTANGADKAGETFAKNNAIPVEEFPANWSDISHDDAIVRENQYGKYDAKAGFRRNKQMAEFAAERGGHLVAFWDGESSGTESMIELGEEHLGKDRVHVVDAPDDVSAFPTLESSDSAGGDLEAADFDEDEIERKYIGTMAAKGTDYALLTNGEVRPA